MTTDETPIEFSPRGSAERAQVSAFPHRRFVHTKLWQIAHAPESFTCDPASAEMDTALDEFMLELESYGREESNLLQRMRTLRFTRSGLSATARKRTHHGAGKKCAHRSACRPYRHCH